MVTLGRVCQACHAFVISSSGLDALKGDASVLQDLSKPPTVVTREIAGVNAQCAPGSRKSLNDQGGHC